MVLTSIITWAFASLQGSTLNDFASPATYLVIALNSLIQNTRSPYVDTASLPRYLSCDTSTGIPWGNRTVSNTNPLSSASIPNTGITRQYEFTISRGIIAPDGFNKSAILVNGRYPGPTIEANWGDEIEVLVHNQITFPEEGTSMHFHGLSHSTTPWYDGTPGLSQCPIASGRSSTYKIRADYYGTSWYHSHLSAQYSDGLYGPLVIYGPSSADFDIDVGPILIHDYYRQSYEKIVQNVDSSDFLTGQLNPSDAMMIHGGENYVCAMGTNCETNRTGGLPGFTFQPGKKHLLRLIAPSTLAAPMLFAIDNHTMTVISNDFTPIQPYTTDVLKLGPGQRSDIIVDATGVTGQSYYMRIRQPGTCGFSWQTFGLGAIYYTAAAASGPNRFPDSLPSAAFNAPVSNDCRNDRLDLTIPSYSIPAAQQPDRIITINSTVGLNGTGATVYFMNGGQYIPNFSDPLIGQVANDNESTSYDPHWNAIDLGDAEVVWLVFNNKMNFAHPMHLHGQQFQVLSEGTGVWDGKTIANPQNPQRRDVQIVQASGYAVMQLSGMNPGVWPFHCHVAWHLSAGMSSVLIMKPEELRKEKDKINSYLARTCGA